MNYYPALEASQNIKLNIKMEGREHFSNVTQNWIWNIENKIFLYAGLNHAVIGALIKFLKSEF